MQFLTKLRKSQIIAATRNLDQIDTALKKKSEIIFMVAGDIFDLMKLAINKNIGDTMFIVHLDLLKGIARDEAGINFLKKSFKIDGIISTHTNVIQIAKKAGFITIQRFFILDSDSLKTGAKIVHACKPDGIEILPGIILPSIKEELQMYNFPPIIAGGLVKTKSDVKKIIDCGAIAVSTGKEDLW